MRPDSLRLEQTSVPNPQLAGVPGFAGASQLAWQGASVDLRYKFLDRDATPFGLTFAIETHADRIDETTAALARKYGNELTLAFDRELVPGFVMAGLNLPNPRPR